MCYSFHALHWRTGDKALDVFSSVYEVSNPIYRAPDKEAV
jgi:hypothetical protein